MHPYRRKLIEVSLPLDAINAAAAREKSIRHGHPSTLHLWWARRPLAACRAVLFAQLVDDPSAWPEEFPTAAAQARERRRLHGVIAAIVPWEASGDEHVMGRARWEIARSLARGRGAAAPNRGDPEAVRAWLAEHAPPVCDPFCGGGSILLEAQRLGLRAHGSDLNPVAVLVSKATCEIPPQFADMPPANPEADANRAWRGAEGLAADIRHYGAWMRDRAWERIGHLYPKAEVTADMAAARPDLAPHVGEEPTVIAWLWARTVGSPDPMMRGAHVPLARSFVLSSKPGNRAWVEPIADSSGRAYRFVVRAGDGTPPDGTVGKTIGGARCVLTGAPMPFEYIRSEGRAGRLGARLLAVVAAGARKRIYLDATEDMERLAESARPERLPEGDLPDKALGFSIQRYGMRRYADLFTARQLAVLTTFSDLVSEAREQVKSDASGSAGGAPLAEGGTGAQAYADAVATYLGLGVGRAADYWNGNAVWQPGGSFVAHAFTRQAIPMVWDFCEANPFSSASGNWTDTALEWVAKVVDNLTPTTAAVSIVQMDATGDKCLANNAAVATDPPYYDNIGYADLSDFFYVWQRRTLRSIWPDLFRRVLAPKNEELVATPYRHDNRESAERFFMDGMARALGNMRRAGADGFPITIYYAFKQSEMTKEGLTSPGWATFLQGVLDAGYVIDGTWPVRTERTARSVSIGTNALASSIVLVCRKRADDAPVLTRREFMARLRAELPPALRHIREGNVGPVDMAQAALGPGMGVFTACARVLEPDDAPMTVRTAIALINTVRDEISGAEAEGYDAETRFCIDWFEAFGMETGRAGDAITMAQAYGLGLEDLGATGAFAAEKGRARLLPRAELAADADLAGGAALWTCAQHLARVLNAQNGGAEAAARLLARMEPESAEGARMLAYRLYDICDRKGQAAEAQIWNGLAREWPMLDEALARIEAEEAVNELTLE